MSFWPYTVSEKSKVIQWIRTAVALAIAPGLGTWLLATGQCENWRDYVMAVCFVLIGLLAWGSLIAALVRRARTGKWQA